MDYDSAGIDYKGKVMVRWDREEISPRARSLERLRLAGAKHRRRVRPIRVISATSQ